MVLNFKLLLFQSILLRVRKFVKIVDFLGSADLGASDQVLHDAGLSPDVVRGFVLLLLDRG